MCKKPPKRRKVGDTIRVLIHDEDGNEVNPADVGASVVWSIGGQPTYGTATTLTVPDWAKAGDIIKANVLIGNKTYTASAVVQEDDKQTAVEVTITDLSGFQTDGKGLVGDTLSLSYGSSLGVPKVVTWYYGERVVKTATANAQSLDAVLSLRTGTAYGADYNGQLKDGKYYAVITNEDNKSFTSNTIELTYVEQAAIVSDFAILDETSEYGYVDIDTDDAKAVISVTLNKNYEGTFYIYPEEAEKYSWNNDAAFMNVYADDANVTVESDLTAKNVLDKGTLKYIAKNGHTTYMFKTSSPLTRGDSYKIAFSQDKVESTKISSTPRTDIKVSDSVAVPYLPAPAALEIKTAAIGSAAIVEVQDESGDVLSYLGNGYYDADDAGFSSFIVYGNNAMTAKDAKALDKTSGYFDEGVYTGDTALAGAYKFFYAEAKTVAGIFGEKSATITSGFKTENTAIAATAKISEDGTDPAKANVALTNVAGPATAYIYNSDLTTFDKDNKQTYLGKAAIKAGDASVSFDNVFKKENKGQTFNVVILPDDENMFVKMQGADFELTATAAELKFDHGTGSVTGTTGTPAGTAADITITDTGLIAYDQFGELMVGGQSATDVTSVSVTNKDNTSVESGTAKFSVAPVTGQITVVLKQMATGAKAIDRGDGFKISLLGSEITLNAAKDAVALGQNLATATNGLEVKVGGEDLLVGPYLKSIGATAAAAATTGTATATYGATTVTPTEKALIGSDGAAYTPVATWTESASVYSDSDMTVDTGVKVVVTITATNGNATMALDAATLDAGTYYFKYLGCTYTLTVNKATLAVGQILLTITGTDAQTAAALTGTTKTTSELNQTTTYTFAPAVTSEPLFTSAMTTADAGEKCTYDATTGVLTIPEAAADGSTVVITFTGTGNYTGTVTYTITITNAS